MKESNSLFQSHPVLRLLEKGEEVLLCLLLAAMITVACLQILLRTFFSSGLMWADPLLRYLVLWCGLLGAVLATSKGKHISLDLINNKLSPTIRSWVSVTTYLFCIIVSLGLTWAGWIFLQNEIEFSSPGPLSLPNWLWNTIFPVAFGLITIKYTILFWMQAKAVLSKTPRAFNEPS